MPRAEIEKIGVAEELAGQRFVDSGFVGVQDRLDLVRDARELLHQSCARLRREACRAPGRDDSAISMSAVSWQVKALVEATPISGPACVKIVPSASRVIIEPTTLQMASVFEPFCLASRCAASVSAVSPDWLMQITSVLAFDDRIAIAEFAAVVHFDGNVAPAARS